MQVKQALVCETDRVESGKGVAGGKASLRWLDMPQWFIL
jgi:hypothetical protein